MFEFVVIPLDAPPNLKHLVRGDHTLKTAGGQVADAGKYLVIWKQEIGAWKLHRDVWTTSRPAA
jgi:ketosteroid isomerase-like protein